MQDNEKSSTDKAVSSINLIIAQDIMACGDSNLSMAFLSNSFSSAIYKFLETVGIAGQLSVLADVSVQTVPLGDKTLDTRDVASVLASTAFEALMHRMRPKMIDMCRRVHQGNKLETLSAVASVLERASLENDPGMDHSTLREAAAFARGVCNDGFPTNYDVTLALLPATLKSLVDRRKDKALLARLGEPLEGLVRLANKAADLAHLNEIDPDGFKASVNDELSVRSTGTPALAA